jgi:hypothetical protein
MGRGVLPALSTAACIAALAGSAHADVKPVEPRMMVMASDGAMRCDTGNIYYAVRTLKAGEMIRVDGEGGGWLRVEYPSGTKAYVRADEASFDAAAKSVKLTKATKLMAANDGGARPWWPLLNNDLAAGTTFASAEPVRGADGAVDGYLIPAPSGAHGFIRAEQARAATPAEITKASGAPATTTTAAAPEPKPQIKTDPATSAVVAAATTATETKPLETKPVVETRPAEPKPIEPKPVVATPPISTPVIATPAPAPAPMPAPAVARPAEITTSDDAKLIEVKPTAAQPVSPETSMAVVGKAAKPEVTHRIDDIKVLRDMFEKALQPGTDEAEVTTVISEFNRTIDSLATSGDEGKIRAGLQQRMTALKMRQEIIDTKRKIADTSQIDEQMRQIKLAVETVQKQAIYATVGRILPSTVYDGKRGMPLMYRVESADFSSTRTIGYVVPSAGMDLLPYLGKIVGIVGETRMDPALSLNIIAPTRVDEMRVSGGKLEVVPGTTPSQFVPEGSTTEPASPAGAPAASTMPTKPAVKPAAKQPETAPQSQPVATPSPDDEDMNK